MGLGSPRLHPQRTETIHYTGTGREDSQKDRSDALDRHGNQDWQLAKQTATQTGSLYCECCSSGTSDLGWRDPTGAAAQPSNGDDLSSGGCLICGVGTPHQRNGDYLTSGFRSTSQSIKGQAACAGAVSSYLPPKSDWESSILRSPSEAKDRFKCGGIHCSLISNHEQLWQPGARANANPGERLSTL